MREEIINCEDDETSGCSGTTLTDNSSREPPLVRDSTIGNGNNDVVVIESSRNQVTSSTKRHVSFADTSDATKRQYESRNAPIHQSYDERIIQQQQQQRHRRWMVGIGIVASAVVCFVINGVSASKDPVKSFSSNIVKRRFLREGTNDILPEIADGFWNEKNTAAFDNHRHHNDLIDKSERGEVSDDAFRIRFEGKEYVSSNHFANEDPERIALCDENCCRASFSWSETFSESVRQQEDASRHRRLQEASFPLPKWASYMIVIGLTCFSALFSGLTLGLLGLDKTGLEIIIDGDDPVAASQAKKIAPVRENGNLLLCTLLLGNVSVNALLSIVMADIAGGLTGFFVSTAVLVVFGEIIPQAVCSRYALEIGSRVVPIVRVLIVIFFPVAYPLAWCLNMALGHELGTIYSKGEFLKLLEIHAERGGFNREMATAMAGALKYQDLKVEEVMTPWDKVFTLSVDDNLSYDTIVAIFKTGYSRIPIYEGNNRNNVVGLLFVKDLIFVDPEDETPLHNFVRIFGRGVHVVWPDDTLGDVLRELKQGKSHMALVRDVNNQDETQDPFYEIKGIITLEDIVEEILGDEIVDETDVFIDEMHNVKVNRGQGGGNDFDFDKLRWLDHKIVDKTLGGSEAKAVTAFLRAHYKQVVEDLTDRQLELLVGSTVVCEVAGPSDKQPRDSISVNTGTTTKDAASQRDQNGGLSISNHGDDTLYVKGEASDTCTLILSGKVTVFAGSDEFRSDLGPWSVLGTQALMTKTTSNTGDERDYIPDFSAKVTAGPCRLLRFTKSAFTVAVDASKAERLQMESAAAAAANGHNSGRSLSRKNSRTLSVRSRTSGGAGGERDPESASFPDMPAAERRGKLLAAFQKKVLKKESSSSSLESGDDPDSDGKKKKKKKHRDKDNSSHDGKESFSGTNGATPTLLTEENPLPSPSFGNAGIAEMAALKDKLTDGGALVPRSDKSTRKVVVEDKEEESSRNINSEDVDFIRAQYND